jgi:hypothetical protein
MKTVTAINEPLKILVAGQVLLAKGYSVHDNGTRYVTLCEGHTVTEQTVIVPRGTAFECAPGEIKKAEISFPVVVPG